MLHIRYFRTAICYLLSNANPRATLPESTQMTLLFKNDMRPSDAANWGEYITSPLRSAFSQNTDSLTIPVPSMRAAFQRLSQPAFHRILQHSILECRRLLPPLNICRLIVSALRRKQACALQRSRSLGFETASPEPSRKEKVTFPPETPDFLRKRESPSSRSAA